MLWLAVISRRAASTFAACPTRSTRPAPAAAWCWGLPQFLPPRRWKWITGFSAGRTSPSELSPCASFILWFDWIATILSSRPAHAPPARAVTVQDGHRPSRSDAQRPGGSRARWHTDADRDERDGNGREYGIGFGAWSDAAVATGQSAAGDRQATTRIAFGGYRRPRQPVSLPGLRQAL